MANAIFEFDARGIHLTSRDHAQALAVALGKVTPPAPDAVICQRLAFHALNASACLRHRSLPGAGLVVHCGQIGASHVPLFRLGTFQSHSSVARRPHLQRRVGVQTKPRRPSTSNGVQGIIGGARR